MLHQYNNNKQPQHHNSSSSVDQRFYENLTKSSRHSASSTTIKDLNCQHHLNRHRNISSARAVEHNQRSHHIIHKKYYQCNQQHSDTSTVYDDQQQRYKQFDYNFHLWNLGFYPTDLMLRTLCNSDTETTISVVPNDMNNGDDEDDATAIVVNNDVISNGIGPIRSGNYVELIDIENETD